MTSLQQMPKNFSQDVGNVTSTGKVCPTAATPEHKQEAKPHTVSGTCWPCSKW